MFGAVIRRGPRRANTLLKAPFATSAIEHSLAGIGCRAIRGKFTVPRNESGELVDEQLFVGCCAYSVVTFGFRSDVVLQYQVFMVQVQDTLLAAPAICHELRRRRPLGSVEC